ncbi:MAG: aspartyl protease family protein, partial [Planctomycetota bacterium]
LLAILSLVLPAAAQERLPRTFPFELSSNKPFIAVRVNGEGPFWFVLDSGASGRSNLYLSTRCARILGIDVQRGRAGARGAGVGVRVRAGKIPSVDFDVHGIRLTRPAMVLPFEHVNPYEGRHLDGLLGHDFMKRFVVQIDYAKRRITLHDPGTFAYRGTGVRVPFRFLGGWPLVSARVAAPGRDAVEARLVVDTGVRNAIMFSRPFAEKQRLADAMPGAVHSTVGGGMGGESRGLYGRLAWVDIGPVRIREPVVAVSRDASGALASARYDGFLGGIVLRRFTVFFDYSRRHMILEPNGTANEPFEHDRSGLFLTARGEGFREITVQSVVRGSPADEIGMRPGDVIMTVDGRRASELGLEGVRKLFVEGKGRCRIGVARETEGRLFKLELRRIL